MTPRSFWIILIRILGIWFLLDSLQIIYSYLTYIPLMSGATALSALLTALFITTLVIAVYFIILYLCLFRTDWIINKLKLDKGFNEEKFEFNLHYSIVLKIAVIVIGGLLIVKAFPLFIRQVILYFQQDNMSGRLSANPTWSYILLYFIESLIGYYLMTSSQTIVNYIEYQRRKSKINQG